MCLRDRTHTHTHTHTHTFHTYTFSTYSKKLNKGIGVNSIHYLNDGLWTMEA